AMRSSAGTDVMVDVLMFRRRKEEESINQDTIDAWVEPSVITFADAVEVSPKVGMSQYFATHPEQVVGTVQAATDQWGNVTYRVSTDDLATVGADLEQRLASVVDDAQRHGLGYGPETNQLAEVQPGLHFAVPAEAAVG